MFFFPNSYTFSIFLILKILKLKIQKIAQAILEPYPNTAWAVSPNLSCILAESKTYLLFFL